MTIDPTTCDCNFRTTCIRDARYVRACEQGRGARHLTEFALAKVRGGGVAPNKILLARPNTERKPRRGPGAVLFAILRRGIPVLGHSFQIDLLKDCGCGCGYKEYATKMNRWGVSGCHKQLEDIVTYLKAEAVEVLGIPFSERAARTLVRWAIRQAKYLEQTTKQKPKTKTKLRTKQSHTYRKKKPGISTAIYRKQAMKQMNDSKTDCVYLGESLGLEKCEQPAYRCNLLDCHIVKGVGNRTVPGCSSCKKRLMQQDEKLIVDCLEIIDRRRKRVDSLRDLLAGQSVFLACSGPSANLLPLEKLNKRGVWTMAVNNMAGHSKFRPQAFVCSDPPLKFSHSIWLDPQIMKFIPTPKMNGSRAKLKRKIGPAKFERLETTASDCPNIWGFRRESWLTPDDQFFLATGACWGNQNAGVKRTGQPKTVNTMFLAMRLLRYLGAKRVFMIGCDFRMSAEYGYAFPQSIAHKRSRDKSKPVGWDNGQYAVANGWLCEMQQKGVFKRFGIEFFNCFQESSLRAFPFVPFEQALVECQGLVEDEPDLSEWYEKK